MSYINRHYQESDSSHFHYNSQQPYGEMRIGNRTGLYFGKCDTNKVKYGFFPNWSDYIDYDSLPRELEEEKTSDLFIPRVPEVFDDVDDMLGKTPNKLIQSKSWLELISVKKYQSQGIIKSPYSSDRFWDRKEEEKMSGNSGIYLSDLKEEGREAFEQIGWQYEERIEQKTETNNVKSMNKREIQSQFGEIAQKIDQIEEAKTDQLHYLQKQEPMVIEGMRKDEKPREKKKRTKKSSEKLKLQELNPDKKQALPKPKRVSIIDKGKIKWPGDSTSLLYLMPSNLAALDGQNNKRNSERAVQQHTLEVVAQYEKMGETYNPWEEETLTLYNQEEQQPVIKKEPKAERKTQRRKNPLKQPEPGESKQAKAKKPAKPKNRSKSSKASSTSNQ